MELFNIERKLNLRIDNLHRQKIDQAKRVDTLVKDYNMQIAQSSTNGSKQIDKLGSIERELKEITKQMDKKTNRRMKKLILEPNRETMIGYLYGPTSLLIVQLHAQTPNVQLVELRDQFKSVCGLAELREKHFYANSSGWVYSTRLLVSDYAMDSIKSLRNYESNIDMTCIKLTAQRARGLRANIYQKYYAFCTNQDDSDQCLDSMKSISIYVCDIELHRVIIFDSTLQRIKRILSGTATPGSDKNESSMKIEFECPRDICYANSFVYVLDQGDHTIDKFNENGDFVCEHDFRRLAAHVDKLWSVRVKQNKMAIIDWKRAVLIYDECISTHALEFKYTLNIESVLSMCLIRSSCSTTCFLCTHSENGNFACYDLSKCQQDDMRAIVETNSSQLRHRSEFIVYSSRGHFIISFGWSKSMALIYI